MRWIAKDPPIYIWAADEWYNERNGAVYYPDVGMGYWRSDEDMIIFSKKSRVLVERAG